MEPIISFVTTYALLAKSQVLLAAVSFAGASLSTQIAIVAAATLAVTLIIFSIYTLCKRAAKKAEAGEEEPEGPTKENPVPPEAPKPNALKKEPKSEPELEAEPLELCCPIGLGLMTDPVIASDGHTYERTEIEKYFKEGINNLSPITQEKFANHDLKPNIKLKDKIREHIRLYNAQTAAADLKKHAELDKPANNGALPPPPPYPSEDDEFWNNNNSENSECELFIPIPPKKR